MKKITQNVISKILCCILFSIVSITSFAENFGPFAIVDSKPLSEFWVNPGFYSYHFNKDANLNDYNLGLGGEYFEHKNMGANIIFTPGYQDRLYAAFSFQLKIKLN